jgi:hypothetical protein
MSSRRVLAVMLFSGAGGLGLSGCSVLSPVPLWELTKGAGHAASHFLGAPRAVDTVLQHAVMPRSLCILHNPHVQSPQVLPALQGEFWRRGVPSRVLEAKAPGLSCDTWLRYEATIELAAPPFEEGHRPVLTAATLTLLTPQGQTLATSSYQASGVFVSGKWQSTRAKLAPVVAALLSGENS